MKKLKILVADDDTKILYAFREVLEKDGHKYVEAETGAAAVEKVAVEKPDMVFMDINMPVMDGLDALQKIKDLDQQVPVIMITGEGTMQTAVQSMRFGAFQYLMKPLSVASIRQEIERAIISNNTAVSTHKDQQLADTGRYQLIGNSTQMQNIYKMIGKVCTTPNTTTVLITGETGTGKELVARAIHQNSAHSREPFIAVNCTALPENLLESELFGHEKGAFTSAVNQKKGKLELAGQGTVFLDEIGDLSQEVQKKLLRVLQEREFERLGDHRSLPVNARFIAATNRDLDERITAGAFRKDLYFRLNVATLHLPPLREHREDIDILAHFFLARHSRQLSKNVIGIGEQVFDYLRHYSFPGNIRELENLIERAVMLTHGNVILPGVLTGVAPLSAAKETAIDLSGLDFSGARDRVIAAFEKKYISEKLAKHRGNVTAAAKECGLSRQNLHRLLKKYGLTHNDGPAK